MAIYGDWRQRSTGAFGQAEKRKLFHDSSLDIRDNVGVNFAPTLSDNRYTTLDMQESE